MDFGARQNDLKNKGMGAQKYSIQNGSWRSPKLFKTKEWEPKDILSKMDFGARQNALKTKEWEPKNILSKMDPGARQNDLKTKGWEPKNILSKMDFGARQNAFKT